MIQLAGHFPLAALSALMSFQSEQTVRTELAWDGLVSTRDFSELTLRTMTNLDATVAVELIGPEPHISADLMLRNGESLTTRLPVVSRGSGDVTLRFSVDGAPWQDLTIGHLRRGEKPVVLVGESAVEALGETPGAIIVAAGDLPGLPAAYTHIEALVLSTDSLARLDEVQLQAFLEFVGLCGRVLLIDPSVSIKRLVSQRAACGSRNIATATTAESASHLAWLLTKPAADLPDERLLDALLDSRTENLRLIAFYLGGFLIVFCVLTAAPRSRSVALSFSVLITLLAALFWDGGNRRDLVAWGETTTTERIARYSSIERASALGRGKQDLKLQSLARSPLRISGESSVLKWNINPGERHIDWSTLLLQEVQVFSVGSFPAESRLRASTDEAGVTVCNRSGGPATVAYLRWQGNTYAIPPLAPGQRLHLTEADITNEVSAHLRLLARRADTLAPTFLHPLEVPGNGADQQAWLMTTETEPQVWSCSA